MLSVRRAGLLSALVAVALFASARAATACTCGGGGPACQIYWNTPVVVDAVVRSIDGAAVTLDVLHVWKGKVGSRITAINGDGSSCDYVFRAGERYLVFAGRSYLDGLTHVSLCSGTHGWNGTGPDAEFLQSLSRPAVGARISGWVSRFTRPGGGVPASASGPGDAELRLTTPAGISTVRTKDGDFQFTGLAPGRYHLSIVAPENLRAYPAAVDVEIPDSRACSVQRFSLTDNGRIAGRLVRHDGTPARSLRLELLTEAAFSGPEPVSPRDAFLQLDGSFEFGALPPGTYVIGVNLRNVLNRDNPYSRILYSAAGSDVHVFTIKPGERVDIGDWRLPPPPPTVAVSGVVTWEDGRPAEGVRVHAVDAVNSWPEAGTAVSGSDGQFTMQLWQQRTYRFKVSLADAEPIFVAAPTLTPGAEPPPPIRIVVRRAPG